MRTYILFIFFLVDCKIIASFWADQKFTAKLVKVASNKRNYTKKAQSKWIGFKYVCKLVCFYNK